MENDSRAIRDLWTRLIASEEGFKAVYEEAIMPEIRRRIASLAERIELLDEPVAAGDGWRELEHGTDLVYKFDTSAEDCRQLFTPRWPVNEKSFAWWEGMFTGKYFFRPEESPVAAYRFEERGGTLAIDAEPKFNNWVYLPSKRTYPTSYVLEFDYTVHQEMRETLQLCFGFDSLASRLRFVLGYNRTIAFEAVESGMFLSAYEREKLWDRLTKPCSLKLGERTHVRLEVMENVFQLSLGGKTVMTARVAGYVPHPARWAIIAWNGFSPEPVGMRMEIENLKVLVRDGR